MKPSIMSPLCFVLIMIIITALIYSFFFLIKCPPPYNIPFLPCYRPPQAQAQAAASSDTDTTTKLAELAAAVVTAKEATGAAGDCPVCLSAFEEGEEIWQLKLCKHLFHASCIDRWLYTHSNCPVCRSYVSLSKRKLPPPSNRPSGVAAREDDLWQGLPNSAGLV